MRSENYVFYTTFKLQLLGRYVAIILLKLSFRIQTKPGVCFVAKCMVTKKKKKKLLLGVHFFIINYKDYIFKLIFIVENKKIITLNVTFLFYVSTCLVKIAFVLPCH